MSYSDQKKRYNKVSIESVLSEDYLKAYFSSDHHERLKNLEDRYVYHLFNDLVSRETNKDLDTFLGSEYRYTNSCAKECVELAYNAREIIEYKLKAWTDSALKCFDNFLLVFIQDFLKESIKEYSAHGKERHKYEHLVEKGNNYAKIGTCFHTIYAQRNVMTHVEIVEKDGRRVQKKLSRKKLKTLKLIILENFETALSILEHKIPD